MTSAGCGISLAGCPEATRAKWQAPLERMNYQAGFYAVTDAFKTGAGLYFGPVAGEVIGYIDEAASNYVDSEWDAQVTFASSQISNDCDRDPRHRGRVRKKSCDDFRDIARMLNDDSVVPDFCWEYPPAGRAGGTPQRPGLDLRPEWRSLRGGPVEPAGGRDGHGAVRADRGGPLAGLGRRLVRPGEPARHGWGRGVRLGRPDGLLAGPLGEARVRAGAQRGARGPASAPRRRWRTGGAGASCP